MDSHHVRHLKQALVVVREPDGPVAGAAVALRAEGRDVLALPATLARRLSEGELRLVRHETPALLAVDDEARVGLLDLPDPPRLEPLRALAAAPAEDGEALVCTGPGLTIPIGAGQERHLWITRSARLSGRLHAFADGERQEEFRYLLDLAVGALPPGSPVVRSADGALLGLLDDAAAPGPGLSLAVPIREAVALAHRLGPRPATGGLA